MRMPFLGAVLLLASGCKARSGDSGVSEAVNDGPYECHCLVGDGFEGDAGTPEY